MPISAAAIARAEHHTRAELTRRDPTLLDAYRRHLRSATRIIARRLSLAAAIENVSLDSLAETAQRQLGNCVANYALGLLGAEQRGNRLRDQAAGHHTMLSWARKCRLVDPSWSALAFFEQWVIDGHPLHPATKVREPMSAADVLDTCPEWGNVVPLVVAPLAPNFAVEHGESTKTGESAGGPFSRLLLVEHPGLRQALADEGLGPGSANLIPMHPWQVHNVLGQRYGDQLRTNALRLLKATIPARPLMSYRTFAPLATTSTRHPHHIKTSLSVRLTSAIRGVSPAAAHNGPIISRLLHAVVHTEANFGGKLRVLAEPAAARFEAPGSTQSSAGLSASAALAALARANPEDELAPEELLLPTGALWANSPLSGQPILGELLDEMCAPHTPGPRPMYTRAQAADHFARGYAELVLPPILTLLTKYGIAMEAHGENTLLAIRRGRPVRYVIRDLGAIRIHPGRLAGQGLHVEPLPGSPVITNDTDELRNKLYHAQFVNDARRLVACLARLSGSPSENFWRHFRDTTRATFAALARQRPLSTAARTDAEALLTRPWPAKALLSMWLGETPNEYTYLPIANPLAYEPSHTTQGDRTG